MCGADHFVGSFFDSPVRLREILKLLCMAIVSSYNLKFILSPKLVEAVAI